MLMKLCQSFFFLSIFKFKTSQQELLKSVITDIADNIFKLLESLQNHLLLARNQKCVCVPITVLFKTQES